MLSAALLSPPVRGITSPRRPKCDSITTPCVLWAGPFTARGYPRSPTPDVAPYAHVAAWEAINGPVPARRHLKRLCASRLCVEPTHYRLPRRNLACVPKPRSRQVKASEIPGIEYMASDPCAYCGGPATSYDHIEPISRGGTNTLDNVTRCCTACNFAKSTRSLLIFLVRRASR